ncbi:MAG TPA: hypothetical protein VGP83_07570 [Pyrinomonadaceae bacterium]|jgi:hypothetical protein|nr:hypothetical protein [Pyrinomonadaceae bacterium]
MKNNIRRITFCCLVISVLASSVVAKDWRGIVPLKSTLADVERLLGPTASGYYNLANEIVAFDVQAKPCDRFGFGWNVPLGTVTRILVLPKGVHRKDEYPLGNDLIVDESAALIYYSDKEAGLTVETYKGLVTLVEYSPKPSEEEPLRCPRGEDIIFDLFPTFDEYGAIAFQDEKARLDNFLVALNNSTARGTLEVRGASPKIRAQLLKRAARAKEYLVKKRGLEPERLLVIDAGYSERCFTRLSRYPLFRSSRIYIFTEKNPK